MAYMTAYIYFQNKAEDYKEFSTAFVELLFGVLHMAQTMMCLCHLYVFKQCIVRLIKSMESLRGRVEVSSTSKDITKSAKRREMNRVNDVSDNSKVKDSFVDNRLSGDKVRFAQRAPNLSVLSKY